jgi:CHASE2 domain-containing sensor protein
VISGKIPASKYADKIVIIGATAAGVGTQFPTPAGPGLSPAETIAHITSSILSEHFIVQPGWGVWATLGVLLLVAGYLVAGLPRLRRARPPSSPGVVCTAAGGRVWFAVGVRNVAQVCLSRSPCW